MSEEVKKNVFDSAIVEFRKKIFDNRTGLYNKDSIKSQEFKELREDAERRTELYDYMMEVLKEYDEKPLIGQPILRTTATVWESGTNEEIKRELEAHPDFGIIFNIPSYLTNTERTRRNMRERLEDNKEENKKREDERKRLRDEQEQKLKEQQAFEKKEMEDRLERTKVLQERARLKREATTEKRKATIAEKKKKEEEELKEAEEELRVQEAKEAKEKEERIRVLRFKIEKFKKAEVIAKMLGAKNKKETKKQKQERQEIEQAVKELEELVVEEPVNEELLKQEREKEQEKQERYKQYRERRQRKIEEERRAQELITEQIKQQKEQDEQDELRDRKIRESKKPIPKPKPQLSEEAKKKAADRRAKIKKLVKPRIAKEVEVDLGKLKKEKKKKERIKVGEAREKILKAERIRTGIDSEEDKKDKKDKKEMEEKGIEREPGETDAEYKRRYEQYTETLQFRGLERRVGENRADYVKRYLEYTNKLMRDITPGMSERKQRQQLGDNRDRLYHQDPTSDELYEMFSNYGISRTLTNVLNLLGPASVAIDDAGSLPLYISHNLIRRGFNNLVNFLWRKGKIKDEDIISSKDEDFISSKDDLGEEYKDLIEDEYEDFIEEEEKKDEAEEKQKRRNDTLSNVVGLGLAGSVLERVTRPSEGITTKPVSSVIDNRPINIATDKTTGKQTGQRSEGGRRKYSPQFIYPDDEILEPTEKQLSRNEYNLAKFDFINPDNVGGNNSNGDNPLYKANDTELAIRYFDWKNMVMEKENEFVKQLPPKVSDRIKKQFRRSFVEPAEPIQTRLNYMIYDETQFAPFNSPYSEMTVNTGTNPFIQTSVLYGSVP